MTRLDPHSYADDAQARVSHLEWDARVDFGLRTIEAEAVLTFAAPAERAGPLDLDTRDLAIDAVSDVGGSPLAFRLDDPEQILGARLRIEVPAGAAGVRIRYRTSPDASALQWLGPEQTGGGTHPFLYTQCQAIHARSVVPLPDTPRTRLTYGARLRVPKDLRGLMAGVADGCEEIGDEAVERYHLPWPISPYLFAFAVGDVTSRELGPRSRVWAEPRVVGAAAWELADAERMLEAGEALFGPYPWGRYDLLVLPPAFPYGGMENPCLTFVTPTMIAGDRSLVALVAHELAHSWTGNLVSNADAEHFWLNEGFTTYAERRIVEALWRSDTAALEWALGRQALDEAIAGHEREGHPGLTRLRTELAGVDPDEGYSVVPYEKGALLLRALEERVGRERFDAFLRAYLERFRFGAVTSEEFLAFAAEHLPPGTLEAVRANEWLYEPDVPANAPSPRSTRLETVQAVGGGLPSEALAREWGAIEWQIYLGSLPENVPMEQLAELDRRYGLTASRNYDVLEKWLTAAARAGYAPALPRTEEVLRKVGRGKYLRPLYRALARRPETRALARSLYEQNAARYHPIARQVVAHVLAMAEPDA